MYGEAPDNDGWTEFKVRMRNCHIEGVEITGGFVLCFDGFMIRPKDESNPIDRLTAELAAAKDKIAQLEYAALKVVG